MNTYNVSEMVLQRVSFEHQTLLEDNLNLLNYSPDYRILFDVSDKNLSISDVYYINKNMFEIQDVIQTINWHYQTRNMDRITTNIKEYDSNGNVTNIRPRGSLKRENQNTRAEAFSNLGKQSFVTFRAMIETFKRLSKKMNDDDILNNFQIAYYMDRAGKLGGDTGIGG